MRPLGKRIIIVADEVAETTKSGIILVSKADDRPTTGVIHEVGPDVTLVSKGERVMFKKYGPDEVEIEGEKYLICDEEDLIATL